MSYMVEYEGIEFDEFEFRKDLPYIINALTTPEPHDIDLAVWENKYGEELIDKIKDDLDEFVVGYCDYFLEG